MADALVLLFVCVCLWFRFCREGWVWVGCRSPIAQLVERATVNRKVAGSNPAGRVAFEFSCTNTHSQLRSLACHDMAWHGGLVAPAQQQRPTALDCVGRQADAKPNRNPIFKCSLVHVFFLVTSVGLRLSSTAAGGSGIVAVAPTTRDS